VRTTKIAHDAPKSCPEDTVWRVIGTMSGTSCDGLDVVLVEIRDGGTAVTLLESTAFDYGPEWSERMRGLPALSDPEALRFEQEWTGWASDRIAGCLRVWTAVHGPAHLIGFSGHTWYHEPGGRGTRAIGDGALLTRTLGLPVVADYRSADVAAGGQGAPLVPLFDSVVLSGHGACLNLGGIANLTWLPQSADGPVRAADLCGANLLLNRQARRAGLAFDREGDLARSGTVQAEALMRLQQWPYLHRNGPKSLAAEDLAALHDILDGISDPRDASATAVEWVAQTVTVNLDPVEEANRTLLVTGGGAHHRYLTERLRTLLPKGWALEVPEPEWVDGKEAIAFAWLALRTAQGKPTSLATVTGASQDVCGGVLFGTFATP